MHRACSPLSSPDSSRRSDWRYFHKLGHSCLSQCLQILPVIHLSGKGSLLCVCVSLLMVVSLPGWFSSLGSSPTPASLALTCSLLGVPPRTKLVAWDGTYLGFSSGLRATVEGRSYYRLPSSPPGPIGSI